MLPDYIQKTLNDALKENYFDELKAAFKLNKLIFYLTRFFNLLIFPI